jgi:putative flippase GtrA
MLQQLADARRFFSENDWRTILTRMNARDTHPMIQFMKYGICGVGAMLLHQLIWGVCSLWLFPALEGANEVRALHTTYNNAIAFCFSNLFAYITNSLWVFTPGRHGRVLEFLFFTLAGSVGFIAGLTAGPLLIHQYGISTLAAQGSLIIASVLVNFVCRKFFVFKG